jgi:hypothetical protein
VCVRAHHQLVVSIGPTPPPSAEYDGIEYAALPVNVSIFVNAVSHNVIKWMPFWRRLVLIRNGLVCSLIRDCAVSWRGGADSSDESACSRQGAVADHADVAVAA